MPLVSLVFGPPLIDDILDIDDSFFSVAIFTTSHSGQLSLEERSVCPYLKSLTAFDSSNFGMAPHDGDSLGPPSYSEVAVHDTNCAETDQLQATDSQMEDFLHQAQQLKHRWEGEKLRSFLLCMLKVDFGVATWGEEFSLKKSGFAIDLNNFFILREAKFGVDKACEAANLFLAQMPEAVERINVRFDLLCQMLVTFRGQVAGVGPSKVYHLYISSLLFAPVHVMAKKLWIDRSEYIDALTPHDNLLRIRLHCALTAKQMRFFEFISSEEDYALTAVGKQRLERQTRATSARCYRQPGCVVS